MQFGPFNEIENLNILLLRFTGEGEGILVCKFKELFAI
jgi:hypothetical protein